MRLNATSLIHPVERLGAVVVELLDAFGAFWVFVAQTFGLSFAAWWRWRNWRLLAPQLFEVGTRSVPVILVTGAFVGMVLAVQAYDQFAAAGLADRPRWTGRRQGGHGLV